MPVPALITVLAAAREVDLTVTGRRSGRESTRPVWFVRDADELFLVPIYGTDSEWYKNVVARPDIRVTVGGTELHAHAKPVADRGRVGEIVAAFRTKYGGATFDRLYPKPDAAVELPLT
jgi:deazaflavin-dependent oxidoreductase (nitroreductase family)